MKPVKKHKKLFFLNYREGCGLFGHVDFDFEAIKKLKIAKCDNFFLKERGKNGLNVFS